MQSSIEHAPSFAWLRLRLQPGDSVDAEAGAMVTMAHSIAMTTRLNAGRRAGLWRKATALVRALLRKWFGGETMFINTFEAKAEGEVVLAPKLSGAIVEHRLAAGQTLWVQRGSYLASSGQIDAEVRWGGLRGFFGGEGLTLLECRGEGSLFVNTYGGVVEVPVDGSFTVDTGHIVAFEGSLDFAVRKAGNLKSFFFSGEGFVCEFRGRGRLWVQSRNLPQTVSWLRNLV